MDPVVAGSLITAGAGLIGNLFNAGSTSRANRTNIDLAKNAMKYRIDDLRNAGMSPLLAGDSGASFSPVAAPQLDLASLSDSAKNYMAAKKQKHETDVLDATADKAKSDIALNETNQELAEVNQEVGEAQRDYVEAQTDALKAETDFKKVFGFGPIDPKSMLIYQGYKTLTDQTDSDGNSYFNPDSSITSGLGNMASDYVKNHNPFVNQSKVDEAYNNMKSRNGKFVKLNWFEKNAVMKRIYKEVKNKK